MKTACCLGRGCCCTFTNKSGSLSHRGREREPRAPASGVSYVSEPAGALRLPEALAPATPCSLPAAIHPSAPARELMLGRGKYLLSDFFLSFFFPLLFLVHAESPETLGGLSAGAMSVSGRKCKGQGSFLFLGV